MIKNERNENQIHKSLISSVKKYKSPYHFENINMDKENNGIFKRNLYTIKFGSLEWVFFMCFNESLLIKQNDNHLWIIDAKNNSSLKIG